MKKILKEEKKTCVNRAFNISYNRFRTGEEGQLVEDNRRFLEQWHKGTELVNGVLVYGGQLGGEGGND